MAPVATMPTKPETTRDLPPGYYTVDEAAAKLRVGTRFLRDGFNHGGFPGARMSGRLVFSDADLDEIYRMHRSPARPVPRQRRSPRRRAA
ncbi:helix-turn-helix domain-containing protein [Peterkaempfera sp. SMS 1(5)a]|uniref:helix-turn-helix domain-containing protein n=1 Tax=Peterkaempfera podocarpi TaxID=3232308 RepID=UPI0036712946